MKSHARCGNSDTHSAPRTSDKIFPTPENESFYATNPYSRLDANQKEIRLLKIHPKDGTGSIKCTLMPSIPLDQARGLYTALSYCAGDPIKTDVIIVNGIKFNAFANLRHALGEVREFWGKTYKHVNKDLLLWTDQLCIDQMDSQERSHQVGFMRDIYEQAEQVLACLSTSKGSPKGMEWLIELATNVPALDSDLKLFQERRQLTRKVKNDKFEEVVGEAPLDRNHCRRLRSYMWARLFDEKFTCSWLAFYDVVGSPWWSRAWIFQEFLVAPVLHLLYRRRSISWTNAVPILRSLLDMHGYLHQYFFEINPDFVLDSTAHRNVDRIRHRIQACGYQPVMDVVDFMAASKNDWTGQLGIKDLLTHARYCNATDLRDKVYAFIGLGDPGYQIVPDYSLSLYQVLLETTRRIIEYEDSLEILTYAVASRKDTLANLPSWVVDWTQKELGDRRDNELGSEEFKMMFGVPHELPDATFVFTGASSRAPCSLALAAWGVFLDTLVTEMIECGSPQRHELFNSFKTEKGVDVFCSSAVQHYDQLWFLQGSRSLLVLRSVGKDYMLVSAAFVICTLPFKESLPQFLEEAEGCQGGRQRILIV